MAQGTNKRSRRGTAKPRRAGDAKKRGHGEAKKGSKASGAPTARRPSPTAIRQQRAREEKLKLIREQVKEGTLTIRQMTPEERERYPARDTGAKGGKRRKSAR